MKQHTAKGTMLGSEFRLIPPGSEDFWVYGGDETVERAREWAMRRELLLYAGNADQCVHGLYRMDSCTFSACTTVGLDHTQIWVQGDARGAFLLTQPYVEQLPERIVTYGFMHGLSVDSYDHDGWYGHRSMPIRLAIPQSWPLWPIERDAAVVLHTQPIRWHEDDAS
jgi:hypothetical protein